MGRVMPGATPMHDRAKSISRFVGFLTQHVVGVAMFEDVTVYLLQQGELGYAIVFPWNLDEYMEDWIICTADGEGLVHTIECPTQEYLEALSCANSSSST